MKRHHILTTGLLTALALSLPSQLVAQAKQSRPNIIVIFTDDHGYADLSCQGYLSDVKTPHIDQLAKDGVRMTNGYITAPQCIPSRAGILTGRYQQRFGLDANGSIPLPLEEITIGQRLQKAGYITGMIGKWHLDPNHQSAVWIKKNMAGVLEKAKGKKNNKIRIPERLRQKYDPNVRGFTEVFCGHIQRYFATYDLKGNDLAPGGEWQKEKGYRLDIQSDAAVTFINRNHNKPFFLYLAYFAPHVPLEATNKYLSRFPGEMPERRRHALAMISAMDDGVGRIRETLVRHGIDKNTLIFFISDNGAPLKRGMKDLPLTMKGGAWDGSRNDPLVGEKGMLTEGGIRVPYIVTWPGSLPEGKIYDHPVTSLDVAATALALAKQPAARELDGTNLIPYLNGTNSGVPHAALYWRFWNQSAIRKGKWKYLQVGGEQRYLFDLSSPKHEEENLIKKQPEIAKQLSMELKKWASSLKTPGVPDAELNGQEKEFYKYYFK
ncbi:MAG: arylsulfatase A-like enzyme [Rubritalea sp.]|jgi:arylsulfatase A-like enzyme